jgi:hypothetical protein
VERVRAIFARLLRDVRREYPMLRVELRVGSARSFPAARDYARCIYPTRNPARSSAARVRASVIEVAPKMGGASAARIEALLRHEFGHAILGHAGIVDHAERQADAVAEALWGDPIYYDAIDVQTLQGGKWPRPAYLPS